MIDDDVNGFVHDGGDTPANGADKHSKKSGMNVGQATKCRTPVRYGSNWGIPPKKES